jgi:chemotaxis protein CheD
VSGREVGVRGADLRAGGAHATLLTVGVGSCVARGVSDALARVGGMAHILLPSPALSRNDSNPAKFPQSAVPRLIELMADRGARVQRITARLAGGASMFSALAPPGTIQMGERNLVAARQVLSSYGVPLVGEAVGGDFGRTVRLRVSDGRVEVTTVAHGVQHL